jgi:hypothetical protein
MKNIKEIVGDPHIQIRREELQKEIIEAYKIAGENYYDG